MLPLLIAAGAGLGAYKGYQDNKREQKDREIAAATARYSPWTGMQPQAVRRSEGVVGGAAQGGMSGAMLGQNINAMNGQQAQQDAMTNYYKSQTPPPSAAPSAAPAASSPMVTSSPGAVGGPQQSMMQRPGYAPNSWQALAMQQRGY